MCYPVCGMVHIKEPLLLMEKSSPCVLIECVFKNKNPHFFPLSSFISLFVADPGCPSHAPDWGGERGHLQVPERVRLVQA